MWKIVSRCKFFLIIYTHTFKFLCLQRSDQKHIYLFIFKLVLQYEDDPLLNYLELHTNHQANFYILFEKLEIFCKKFLKKNCLRLLKNQFLSQSWHQSFNSYIKSKSRNPSQLWYILVILFSLFSFLILKFKKYLSLNILSV